MPFGFHPAYLVVLLVIVLVIFGPGKLPDLGSALGRTMREFRKASDETTDPSPDSKPGPDDPGRPE